MRSVDVAIVGGGIAGAALAAALAHDGLGVAVLEATEQYEDRVRGESMMPWGVKEARELGVEATLIDAGAHVAASWVHYDADVPSEVSEANPIPVGLMVPDVSGSLNLRHPDACSALASAAEAAGAEVIRGVTDVRVTPGAAPSVSGAVDGRDVGFGARLVVGADGRSSAVRRQCAIRQNRQPEMHMIAGLLLEGLDGLPDESDFLASESDLFMASFHVAGGRLRTYLCPGLAQRHRFSGPRGTEEFLRSSAFGCLPFGEALGRARPAGPLATYSADDTWTERPFVDGVVLIGDAAGFNNPIIGQGLSISMRDARSVRDIVRAGDFGPAAFEPYATERMERMRRLRYAATLLAVAFAQDGDDRAARRARYFDLRQTEPLMMGVLATVFAGPEVGPAEAFDGRLLSALRGSGPVLGAGG